MPERVRATVTVALLCLCCLGLMVGTPLTASALAPKTRKRPDPTTILGQALLGTRELVPVLAPTPPPTTATGDPKILTAADARTTFCGATPIVIDPANFVTGVSREFDGSYPVSNNPSFDFSYDIDDVYDFRSVAPARAYVQQFASVFASCDTYQYTSVVAATYTVDKTLRVPKFGDQSSVTTATAMFTDGTKRTDIWSLVRVGRLANLLYAQISDVPTQSQIAKIAAAQASLAAKASKLVPKPPKAATTTTVKAQPSSVKTSCDLLTTAELQSALGLALQDGVESFDCTYALAQGTGGVTIAVSTATSDPNSGKRFYQSAIGNTHPQPIHVEGAAEASYGTGYTNSLGQMSEQVAVLTKDGKSFGIEVGGDALSQVDQAHLIAAATIAVKHLNGGS